MPDLRSGPPSVPLDLVAWLEAVYPERLPSAQPGETREERYAKLDRLQGSLEVVRLLRDHAARQAQARSTPARTST